MGDDKHSSDQHTRAQDQTADVDTDGGPARSAALPPDMIETRAFDLGEHRAPATPDVTVGVSAAMSLHGTEPIAREASVRSVATAEASDANPRYVLLEQLGAGGMGEVWRVRDRELHRLVAMKLLHGRMASRPDLLARFVEEAQIAAQLQHPGIVPVHDIGCLEDGRIFFIMREVKGRTLTTVIRDVHAASRDGQWGTSPSGWTFRRLVDAFLRVCEAVAFAHRHGVIHRDLKPSNVMVGHSGEIYVVDWGLAKVLGHRELPRGGEDLAEVVTGGRSGSFATQLGAIGGTPAYMPPEQASGVPDAITQRSDVFALGATLYHILAGRPPFERPTLEDVLHGVPPSLASLDIPVVSPTLIEICERAIDRDAHRRYADAGELASAIADWLDGARRVERARAWLEDADRLEGQSGELRGRARELRRAADAELETIPPWADEEQKVQAWAALGQAEWLERQASLKHLEAEHLLRNALVHAPDFAEPHARLAHRHAEAHRAAEEVGDDELRVRAEFALREHMEALPQHHPVRREMATYLKGLGALTLVTDPPGAEVTLYRYEPWRRRLRPRKVRSLGRTPLLNLPLESGSYLLTLEAPGRFPVRYPVHIPRLSHHDGCRPGSADPAPIVLPQYGELGPDEVYIPAGYFRAGGDPQAEGSLPATRYWLDAFVIKRFPVTNAAWLAFLNDLVANGREQDALRYVPRERAAAAETRAGPMIYGRDDRGRFCLQPDADGDLWLPEWPVVMVDWFSAMAYASWLGPHWRLPTELEREKATRGVDGRAFPWGNTFDPSWCCTDASHGGYKTPSAIDGFPVDESPYGVRGVAGNVMDWCLEAFSTDGPGPAPFVPIHDLDAEKADPTVPRTNKGGGWAVGPLFSRAARRRGNSPLIRGITIGLRPARPWR